LSKVLAPEQEWSRASVDLQPNGFSQAEGFAGFGQGLTDAAGNTTAFEYVAGGLPGAGQVAIVTNPLLQNSYFA